MSIGYDYVKREVYSEKDKDIKIIYSPSLMIKGKNVLISNDNIIYEFGTKEKALAFAKSVYEKHKDYFEELESINGFNFKSTIEFENCIKDNLEYNDKMREILYKIEEVLKDEFNCKLDVRYANKLSKKEINIIKEEKEYEGK